ncbi:MAG TPA: sensor histidine kinase [Pyrinomonadaceae bacterium]|nr:sensor histidine kinase [Pyrinomonadaceae bacterium]
MDTGKLTNLAELILQNREALLAEWRQDVCALPAAQHLDIPTLNDEIPQLLEKLAEELKRNSDTIDAETNALSTEHGLLRWQADFDVTEVVAEYNVLRTCVRNLGERNGLVLTGRAARIVNALLDDAIAKAIKAFETMMTIELRHQHQEHIAFMLHDLRTPLDAIHLATLLLDRELAPNVRSEAVESAFSVLRGNADRMGERVRYVLHQRSGIGKALQGEFTMLNLHDYVMKAIRDLGPLAKQAQIKVANNVPSDIEIYSDAQLLAQLLQNLLSNALKFTNKGTVTFGAERTDNGAVVCWLKDTGAGIAPDRIESIFERFETDASPERRGIGLGLSIVKEIVDLHNGEIKVQSRIGEGSTFTFTVPPPKTN